MKNKKGSIFGMVISMTLFLSFLVVFYVYFSPQMKIRNEGQDYLNQLFNNLENSMKVNLSVINIKVNLMGTAMGGGGSSVSCFEIDNLPNIIGNISVRDSIDSPVRSDYSSPELKIEKSTNKFFKIYSSKYLDKPSSFSPSLCNVLDSSKYSIGLVKIEKIISEKKILSLNKSFYDNYAELKSNLSIPSNYNFDFIFKGSQTINASRKKEASNIYAVNEKVIYINESGAILPGDLEIELW